MPTSITVAPGLIQSALTNSGLPMAATRISARRASAGRSRERECAMVTVALAASSNCAAGLPNSSERPITSTSLPAMSPTYSLSSSITPGGRAGHQMGAARQQQPRIGGRQRIDILGGIERVQHGGFVADAWAAATAPGCRAPICRRTVRAPWRAGFPAWRRRAAPTCTDLKPSASAVLPLLRT